MKASRIVSFSRLFAAALLPALLSPGCTADPGPRPPGPEPAPDERGCNYYWQKKKVHVCILKMTPEECAFLFRMRTDFVKEETCVCLQPGRVRKKVTSSGYVQISCTEEK